MKTQSGNSSGILWINAFYNPYKFWRNPFKWTKTFFRSFKIARDRIIKGWSAYDVWDLYTYVNQILGDGLAYLADNHAAYPGDNKFSTSELWEDWLRAQAKAFQDANKDNDLENPFADKYLRYLEKQHWERDEEGNLFIKLECPMDLQQKYYEMDRTIQERKDTAVRMALKELGEHWTSLWD